MEYGLKNPGVQTTRSSDPLSLTPKFEIRRPKGHTTSSVPDARGNRSPPQTNPEGGFLLHNHSHKQEKISADGVAYSANPRILSSIGRVAERLKAPVLKTGGEKSLVGSNPTPSAKYGE